MIKRLLIANRGEIACRIIRSAKKMGITSIAVYSDADEKAQHVLHADEAYPLGGFHAKDSYLDQEKLIQIAKQHNVDAIHPGYGFLSENAGFAKRCQENKVIFVGPSPEAIVSMGDKSLAKKLMQKAQVPTIPGYEEENQEADLLQKAADKIGYPILIKAAGGGGGKGMRLVKTHDAFLDCLKEAQQEAQSSFHQNKILLEKYLSPARHVEIQLLADQHGNYRHIFSRDCSLQRRHQKVLEEGPAPNLPKDLLKFMGETAINAARAINYVGAGTIEFLVDNHHRFYFMEMNTRLQVEHPVTEMISGLDLVEWQLRIAQGDIINFSQDEIKPKGHAIEVRLCAENPAEHFQAATGKLDLLYFPEINDAHQARVDTGFISGDTITPYYDSLIAKLICFGQTREDALDRLKSMLSHVMIAGVDNNLQFLNRLIKLKAVETASISTETLAVFSNELLSTKENLENFPILAAFAAIGEYIKRQESSSYLKNHSHTPNSPWLLRDGWRLCSNNQENLSFWPSDATKPVHFSFEIIEADSAKNKIIHINFNNQEILQEIRIELCSIQLPNIQFKLLSPSNKNTQDIYTHKLFSGGIYQDNASIRIFYAGEDYQWRYAPVKNANKRTHQSQHEIHAPMPCVVIDLLVKIGDEVIAGDSLIVIEAMKMQNTLRAAQDGRVKAIFTQIGELLNEGSLVIELE